MIKRNSKWLISLKLIVNKSLYFGSSLPFFLHLSFPTSISSFSHSFHCQFCQFRLFIFGFPLLPSTALTIGLIHRCSLSISFISSFFRLLFSSKSRPFCQLGVGSAFAISSSFSIFSRSNPPFLFFSIFAAATLFSAQNWLNGAPGRHICVLRAIRGNCGGHWKLRKSLFLGANPGWRWAKRPMGHRSFPPFHPFIRLFQPNWQFWCQKKGIEWERWRGKPLGWVEDGKAAAAIFEWMEQWKWGKGFGLCFLAFPNMETHY